MNEKDLFDLMEIAKSQIRDIKNKAESGPVNKVLVKNTLENLKSTLDYCAIDIRKMLDTGFGVASKGKIYFPHCSKEARFNTVMRESFPGLDDHYPIIYKLIRGTQPFARGDSWLEELCDLVNEVKHRNLLQIEDRRSLLLDQSGGIVVKASRGSGIVLKNNFVDGVLQDNVSLDRSGDILITPNGGSTTIEEIRELFVKGKKLELVPFLEKCESNIVMFVNLLLEQLRAPKA